MANNRTLTSANSVFAIQIAGLYPIPQNMQGYSTDDMFSMADVNTAETQMGVDGRLSAGYVPVAREFEFTLQADSESNDIMDNLIAAEDAAREKYVINATIYLPGIGGKYALTRGFLASHTPMAKAGKTLGARKFTVQFQSISKSPV